MRDFLSELSAVATERRPPAAESELSAWERRSGTELPEELRRFYLALDGGAFAGNVELHPFADVAAQGGSGPFELGQRGQTRLLMITRGDFPRHAGGGTLPSWMEQLSPETWVFALKEAAEAALKPARTFEGVLDRVLPPRETETFGENTFARGMNAVTEALSSLPAGLESALRVLVPPRPKRAAKAKSKPKSKAKASKPSRAAKGPAKKAAAKKRAIKKKPAAVKRRPAKKAARKAAKKPSAKKPLKKPSKTRR